MKNIIKGLSICFFVISVIAVNGCSTVKGFGNDVEKTGRTIEKAV